MKKDKIHSIELGRVIAIFAILAMHCQMFLTYWQYQGTPWFGYIFNQTTRFAVPLFFLIAGYLIQPKLSAAPIETLKRYITPLFRIFVVWSLICLLMPFNFGVLFEHGYLAERQGYWHFLAQNPINSLMEGGLVHLWFLPALMLATTLCAFFIHKDMLGWMLPVAALLYLYGTLAGSYQLVTEMWAPFFTRNGPFFSTLLFTAGLLIRQQNVSVTARQALFIAFSGMAIHFGEAYWLSSLGHTFNENDYLFGTLLWSLGGFLWLLAKPELGKGWAITSLSKYVLAIYVSHLPMIILMMNITGMMDMTGASKDAAVLIGTIFLTLTFVTTMSKTSLRRWLFR
ncbi:acyltransferase [Vibrio coralliilyticus]|uniref:Acyltransferase family protein n=1 Tax=Vibrio coralliilyticus TaxID=190893 RepID=A0AAP6ZHR5_9VIBR|nr:acyltransferase family protein [Vibrio coralliilyticus]NOJ21545.1 acyltransferase family protein [Vibrio coralliilyticus]